MTVDRAVTISFLTFALTRLWHMFNMRDPAWPVLLNPITTHPWVWAALGLGILLIVAAVYVPFLALALETVEPGASGWLLCIGGSLVALVAGQLSKMRMLRRLGERKCARKLPASHAAPPPGSRHMALPGPFS